MASPDEGGPVTFGVRDGWRTIAVMLGGVLLGTGGSSLLADPGPEPEVASSARVAAVRCELPEDLGGRLTRVEAQLAKLELVLGELGNSVAVLLDRDRRQAADAGG